MKIIVTGASGFVGSEVVKQALRLPQITTVIALARRKIAVPPNLPPGSDPSKFKSIVINDYDDYSEEAKKEFAGAAACIWTVAITPTKSSLYDWNEVVRVCQTSTLTGLRTMYEAGPVKPFRFIYMSGVGTERDPKKTPSFRPQYSWMRGETETQVLAFAAEHKDDVQAAIVKAGLIKAPGNVIRNAFAAAAGGLLSLPSIFVGEITAVMLDEVINGFTKDTWLNDDLVVRGKRVLETRGE